MIILSQKGFVKQEMNIISFLSFSFLLGPWDLALKATDPLVEGYFLEEWRPKKFRLQKRVSIYISTQYVGMQVQEPLTNNQITFSHPVFFDLPNVTVWMLIRWFSRSLTMATTPDPRLNLCTTLPFRNPRTRKSSPSLPGTQSRQKFSTSTSDSYNNTFPSQHPQKTRPQTASDLRIHYKTSITNIRNNETSVCLKISFSCPRVSCVVVHFASLHCNFITAMR